MHKMRPIRKSSYLILELMVALFLLATCLFPLIKPNVQLYLAEKKRYESQLNYSLQKNLLVDVKQHLLERRYSFSQLKEGVKGQNYELVPIKTTNRESLNREGLLIQAQTAYGSEYIFVEMVK